MAEFIKDVKTIFPWYDNAQKATRYKKGTMDCYPLITSPTAMLPFIIPVKMKPILTPPRPTNWAIYDQYGTLKLNLTPQIPALISGVYEPVANADGSFNTWLIYSGLQPFASNMQIPCGYHYSTMVFQGVQYTSEIFYVPPGFSLSDLHKRYMRITWWNNSDLLGVVYQTGFRQIMYLESELTKMSPEIQEEGTEDGNGNFYPTSQRYVENRRFDEWAAQYVVDAVTAMQMHDNILIEVPAAGESYAARNLKITSSFDSPSNFGLIDVTFQSDAALFSGACRDNFKLSGNTGASCDITITNLVVTGEANAKTFRFTPLQAGQAPTNVLRYEWRSPQKYNGQWQNIDLNTTFGDSFSVGQNSVCVRAICPASNSPEQCVTFTVSIPSSQCPTGIQVYDVVYGTPTDVKPVLIYYSLTGVTTNAKFVEFRAPEITDDWVRYPIAANGTPQTLNYGADVPPGEYVVQMRVVCQISGVDYLSANTNFVITLP